MGIRDYVARKLMNVTAGTAFKMITETGNGFTAWTGDVYDSDIVRACIRPFSKAVGKLQAKHVRRYNGRVDVNPEPYMRFLLEEPNPYMGGHTLLEKVATQFVLNNNAFVLVIRDENGLPVQQYPVPAIMVEAKYVGLELYLKFTFLNGKTLNVPYSEVIHIRNDFKDNDIFGESPYKALAPLMEVVNTTDQGIVKAIRNSGVIRWLLKYTTPMRPEDLKKNVQEFVDNYLSVSSPTFGAAGVDSKADAIRIEPKDYVPNALQQANTKERIYAFFNTNEKIVHSNYTEDEWNSYFEAVIEPVAIQLGEEYSRKLFTRRERGFGNGIYFDASNLQCASLSTKLALQAMVDRGALTPNEWRETFNLSPVADGDKPLRRLDTQTVNQVRRLMGDMNLENINETRMEIMKLFEGGEEDGGKD
ncbi:phage portal protein [Lachnoclostridium pacaense]|uniref:phage portal protein n=1 Tax=Enterocloster hominis (ex Hitch et al. 2024) TaxID=1917870 RepID=UPI001D0F615B|nr:phage portal protein [Lachnoclostridium pacaense]MCC2820654.1 phage portal protein [Lachnoclostridium pacaense]